MSPQHLVQIVIGVFQGIILLLQWGIYRSVNDHETRIRSLEQERSKNWWKADQMAFEGKFDKRLENIEKSLRNIEMHCPGCVRKQERSGSLGE